MSILTKAKALVISVMPGVAKPFLYRLLMGAKIGSGVRIGFGTVLLTQQMELGDHTRIGMFTLIRAASLVTGKYVSIGNLSRIAAHRIELRSRSIIGSRAEVSGDPSEPRSVLRAGMHSWIFERCYINVAREVTFGRNVGVGGATLLFTHGYWLSELDGFPVKYAPVTIGDDVWLPWDCFIMPGVTIGSRVVVGAKSLVMKDVPDGALIGGVPAKVLREVSYREVTFDEKRKMLEELTSDFAVRRGEAFRSEDGRGKTLWHVAGKPLVALHRGETPEGADLVPGALNVVRWPLDRAQARERPCLSLQGYASSSYDLFDGRVRDWLTHARGIGLRFYPWDEE